VWRAYKNGLILTVGFQAQDHWVAVVEGDGIYERSPAIATPAPLASSSRTSTGRRWRRRRRRRRAGSRSPAPP
jgi:hypothetical protein